MFPSVPVADREQLSRVRASLAQDGFDLAMVARDRQHLLDCAASLAIELAEHGGWQVEKYDPHRLETLLADLTLARFDGALRRLADHASTAGSANWPDCLLFIPDAHTLSATELRKLLHLIQSTGHRRLRLVALFVSDAAACESQIAALGQRVARWYLDESPDDLPSRFASANALSHDAWLSAHRQPTAQKNAHRRTAYRPRKRASARAGLLGAASLAIALALGPTLWPDQQQIERLVEYLQPHTVNQAPSLAGVPTFQPVLMDVLPDAAREVSPASSTVDSGAAR
jgi:hypothetical protein